ncbi:MAG TPA: protease modulator HflK [Allosphingosinicella sp.]|jgi:membrane protease subunit HflK|nr:protease modulator HflK [Allosphingosinicella sp.]
MKRFFGWSARRGAVLSDNRGGPWGPSGGDEGGGSGGDGPRNPWGQPPRRRRAKAPGEVTSLDEFLKRSRDRIGRGFPPNDGRPYWLYGLVAFALLWIFFTSIHRIGPQERGVVTTFGRYERTMQPGVGFSWPAPIARVQKVDVENIREIPVPTNSGTENLILTGDQNVINLAYSVRWNIKDPQRFLFQIAEPEVTIREVAESAMRAVVARVSLEDAIGAGRAEIEQSVEQNMQQLLDDYGAGIRIQGVAINQSVPPDAVNEAFLRVSAAQQEAQSDMNDARAYALQITAKAQGDAAAFEKVYAEYRQAPEVTRRRMYYEAMERILSRVDTTIVEAPGVTPYLPLPEVQQRRPGPQQPQQGGQPR